MRVLRVCHRARRGIYLVAGVKKMKTDQHLIVAGAGGNIGSHLVTHLARLPGISRLTLVDPDDYDEGNLRVQNIDALDVGKSKVLAQAAKLQRINPELKVMALAERIEDVPRGLLRCDLMVSCVDSKAARQHINEICFRLGSPWVDSGVLGSQMLARVNAYAAESAEPCLECCWGPDEYALVEQDYLCAAGTGAAFPTLATSALGALAASLAAIEISKILAGDWASSVVSRQVVLDAHHHAMVTTKGRRNPSCRFDHLTWEIEPWHCRPDRTTVEAALTKSGSLQIAGHRFVKDLACPGCGRQENLFRLNRPLARCARCDRRMATTGFTAMDRLDATLPEEVRALTLAQIGVRTGDVVSAGDKHYVITEAA
jgi:adenylyltransferase/sulfurtransferase